MNKNTNLFNQVSLGKRKRLYVYYVYRSHGFQMMQQNPFMKNNSIVNTKSGWASA